MIMHIHTHTGMYIQTTKNLINLIYYYSPIYVSRNYWRFLANSLALLSDGFHMFSDALSLLVALIAFIYAEKHATVSKTYGYKRFEVLAALLMVLHYLSLVF